MSKRIIGLLAVLLLVLFVAGCGGKREKSTTSNSSVNQAQKQEKKIKPSTSGKILEEPSEEFPEEDIEENDTESTGQEGVPNLLEGELPSYPDALKGKNITGRVVMRIRVAPNGKVTEVQLKETTLEKFTDATIDAVKGWRFKPPITENEFNVTIIFSPEGVKKKITRVFPQEEPSSGL